MLDDTGSRLEKIDDFHAYGLDRLWAACQACQDDGWDWDVRLHVVERRLLIAMTVTDPSGSGRLGRFNHVGRVVAAVAGEDVVSELRLRTHSMGSERRRIVLVVEPA